MHDDIAVVGPPASVHAALGALLSAAQEVGLTASGHKFGLYVRAGPDGEVPPESVPGVAQLEELIAAHTPAEQ